MQTHHQAANPAAALTAAIQAAIQAALPPAPGPASAPQPAPVPPRTIYTVGELAEAEPALTVGGIRADLFNRKKNGLADSGAVIRRGRLLLLHRERYMTWLLTHGQEAA
ncbi:hypothetical protein [uncultured Thiodictyon sp.]|uniref:hypothetical protein n=1 Tax=uncultured Thiodictyon sp. TaxID=1846217 RepID=UPI0025E77314|nr:hypothetical protein [uncultured Thiodictyon sp.]